MRTKLTFLLLFIAPIIYGQEVKIQLSPKDSFQLKVINIYPDSFPLISTVFKAENKVGEPLWLLDKAQLEIRENGMSCKIVSLRRISDQTPIKVGLVIDHSGSMMEDYSQLLQLNGKDSLQAYISILDSNTPFPENYVPPIENAKAAVKKFIHTLDQQKDSIQIVGFSSSVDPVVSFTNDSSILNNQIDSLDAEGGTALYDAIYASIKNLTKERGIKVLIALTDGMDNQSRIRPMELLDTALKYEIPIFNIALGSALTDSLKIISDTTQGALFYSKSSLALEEIYLRISKKILAVYELRHLSENMESTDTSRTFELKFTVDSLQLIDGDISTQLPEGVLQRLKEKEQKALYMKYAAYGGVGMGVLLLIGGFYFYNKKVTKLLINSIYPNPSDSEVTINYKLINSGHCTLQVIDVRTQQKIEVGISELNKQVQLNIDALSKGVLLVRIVGTTGRVSKTHKLLKR